MRLSADSLRIDSQSLEKRMTEFLQTRLEESGKKGFVLGLSGGLDSSTTAALCTRIPGPTNVLGLIMPHKDSNPQDKEHALIVTEKFRIPYEVIDITNAVEAIKANYPHTSSTHRVLTDDKYRLNNTIGNIKARVRMTNLYSYANSLDRLVVGSGDKSEFLIGYFTKYGDGGADVFPIGDLYKTQVRMLAKHLGVPEVVVVKPSSPGLWIGQTAEGEIGMKYEELDLILYGLERLMKHEEIAEKLEVSVETVAKVDNMIKKAEHKRRGGIVFKIGYRTPTLDWRTPL